MINIIEPINVYRVHITDGNGLQIDSAAFIGGNNNWKSAALSDLTTASSALTLQAVCGAAGRLY
jgi:hypothetical protein